MTNLEHYFENLLYHGEDIKGEANKNALTEEQQKSVEQCAQYVIYSLFGTREHFDEWINREPASPWHRVEEELPEIGKRVLVSYGGYVQILKRTDGMTSNGRNYWWNEADGLWEQVEKGSYWMPIEPPKEET